MTANKKRAIWRAIAITRWKYLDMASKLDRSKRLLNDWINIEAESDI